MTSERSQRRAWLVVLLGGVSIAITACMIPIPTVQPLTKINLVEETRLVGPQDAQRAAVHLRLLSKELSVQSAEDVALLRGRFIYNVEEWAPTIREQVDGSTLSVTVDQGLGNQIPIGRQDGYENRWDVDLATGIPLDLDIDMGAGDAELDMTGLSLEKLSVTAGSTALTLAFNAPNPRPLGSIALTAGTGRMAATGLGNANFDTLRVFGGAGKVDLDFSGTFTRSAVADVKAGAGQISIRVPAQVGVRVTFTDLVSIGGVDAVGFEKRDDDVYTNGAYGLATETLTIRVTSGIGTVSLLSQ